MDIRVCMLTKNDCYKTNKKMIPAGIIVHSTGANNPNLRRYVQPDDGILGKNTNNNSWNRAGVNKCVHAFIGKDKNGEIKTYQTLPFDICAWGVGNGSKGSYNYKPAYIQFEICEDNLKDDNYFYAVMKEAQELCAYLIRSYPMITIDNVISHHEASVRGYASNHQDCDHWLAKFGKNMDWFRACVLDALAGAPVYSEPKPEVVIEKEKTYKVVAGDNLTKIAVKVYNDKKMWKKIADLNKIKFPYIIRVGQVIKLP